MPQVSPAHKETRRAQIVDAALACFRRSGIAETTMRDILAEAGLSAGAVYSYFPSKDELIQYLGRRSIARWRETFDELLRENEAVSGDRLKSLFASLLAGLKDEAVVAEVACDIDIWARAIHNEKLNDIALDVFSTVAEGFGALLTGAAARNVDIKSRKAGWSLLAHLQGLGLQAALGAPVDIERESGVFAALIDREIARQTRG